ncbi:hypothetical protein, partial [Chamaesiphon sp. OTE_8_metabat_110]|uniref:hypothetical protein n=1 Tax=Chamaesiphon sp. OTE_8_metabat_110 TaxID=2964696 RepID=UPI00286AC2A6
SETGTLFEFNGEPWIPNMVESHVQGVARYGNYLLLSHNNKGYSHGFIIVLNVESMKMVHKICTPDEHYNHPGGMQVIGDYLMVPVENSSYSQSLIHFYDLSMMTDSEPPKNETFGITREFDGAGAAGITNYTDSETEYYLLAAYNNGAIDFYKSNGNPISNDPGFQEILFSATISCETYDSICLLTDVNQQIYMIGFRTYNLGGSNEDYADLYEIDLQKKCVSQVIPSRHFYTEHGGFIGLAGVHFRWGAGLKIVNDSSLNFLATQRNFVGDLFYTNTFLDSSEVKTVTTKFAEV